MPSPPPDRRNSEPGATEPERPVYQPSIEPLHEAPPAPAPASVDPVPLPTRLAAEAVGSGLLVMAVIGSGIMAETLSPTDVGLQLLQNSAATVGALIALITMFATVSGAHFNPAVTLVDRALGALSTRDTAAYIVVQILGGCCGTIVANIMFTEQTGEGWLFLSTKPRNSGAELFAEVVATLGLLLVIHGSVRHGKPYVVGVCVGVWIGGAYFFTSSTSFANPMVSIARTLSDTFAGIEPASAPGFVAMQLIGAAIAIPVVKLLFYFDRRPGASPDPAAESTTSTGPTPSTTSTTTPSEEG